MGIISALKNIVTSKKKRVPHFDEAELSWVTDIDKEFPPRRRLLSFYLVENESGPILSIKFPCGKRDMLQTARPPAMQSMLTRK